jgi:hypothetical protein
MDALKMLNLLIRFLLELGLLAAVGYWGFKTQANWPLKVLFGIGLPILVAVLWGSFIAPKAIYPLSGVSHLTLELFLLASGAIALFASGRPTLGWAYTSVLLVNKILMVVWRQ